METLARDLRYALRSLRKAPVVAVVAAITLALGIGGSAAIANVVYLALIRPLPLPHSEQVLRLHENHNGREANLTGATLHDLREQNRSFSQVAAYRVYSRNLSDPQHASAPEQVDVAAVSRDFFPLLQVGAVAGRTLSPENFLAGAQHEVVISHRLWRERFASNPSAVGSVIELHGLPFRVAGVMPEGFNFPESVDAWLAVTPEGESPANRRAHLFRTIARLKPGISIEQANGDLRQLAADVESESHGSDPGITLQGATLQQQMAASVRPALLLLLGAVGFVLVVACANVGGLMLSSALSRQKESAVRYALGATRARLIRQTLTESIVLGLAGGALGVVVAYTAERWLETTYLSGMAGFERSAGTSTLLFFTFALSLAAAVLFGAAPSWQYSGGNIQEQLAQSGRTMAGGTRQGTRSSLVVTELAIAMVLLVGAGLLLRSFVRLQQVDPGFDAHNVLVVPLAIPGSIYPAFDQQVRLVDSVMAGVSALPGIRTTAATGALPFRPTSETGFELEGRSGEEPAAEVVTATPQFFRSMGLRLLSGRSFTEQDTVSQPTVMMVNKTFARRYWSGENPVGRHMTMKDWGEPLPAEIVGVVSDVKQDSLEESTKPIVYFPLAQFSRGSLVTYLIVRTEGDPAALAGAVRQQIWTIDRSLPANVSTMEQITAETLFRRRSVLMLLGAFALLATVLAVVGIYGLLAHSVAQRSREFGIRMALGAQRHDVLAMVLGQSLRLVLAGTAIGVVAALGMSRVIASMLFSVRPSDPATLLSLPLLLIVAGILAAYFPARKATSADPACVLHEH